MLGGGLGAAAGFPPVVVLVSDQPERARGTPAGFSSSRW
jgi:hypothetical protein